MKNLNFLLRMFLMAVAIVLLMLLFPLLWWVVLYAIPVLMFWALYLFITSWRSGHSESYHGESVLWLKVKEKLYGAWNSFQAVTLLKSFSVALVLLWVGVILVFWGSSGYRKKQVTEQRLEALVVLVQQYHEHTSSYPTSLEEVVGKRPLERDLLKDDWGHLINYRKTTTGYSVFSYGYDGLPQTKDDLSRSAQ